MTRDLTPLDLGRQQMLGMKPGDRVWIIEPETIDHARTSLVPEHHECEYQVVQLDPPMGRLLRRRIVEGEA